MQQNEEPIKVGRINRAVERATEVSLSGDVNIYLAVEEVDRIAKRKPDSYLQYLEEIARILKMPDFVAFSKEEERFYFAKFYRRNHGFQMVFIEVCAKGKPQRWCFQRLYVGGDAHIKAELEKLSFARPQQKPN